jgi:beta-mannosidase
VPFSLIFSHPCNQSGRTLHTTTTRIGFRTAKVVQEPLIDAPGTSFLFEINGRRIFCGGSNWIPADSFLTEVDEDRYRRWLELMVEGNQNMVRVWAGGE